MAMGWSRRGAVHDQIDASIKYAVARLSAGEGPANCERGEKGVRKARLCVRCRSDLEKRLTGVVGINRRASKDSQVK